MSKILVIEDDRNVCWAFEEFLRDGGHQVTAASSAEEGLGTLARDAPDLIVLDVRLPGMSGIDALPEIRRKGCRAPVVVITAHGTMDTAIQAIQRGAFEYLLKPIDLEQAGEVIERALRVGGAGTQGRVEARVLEAHEMLGTHPVMQEVFKQIGAVSQSDVSVLISGSSGAGKELAARAVHRHSRRAEMPFVAVDCARLPETLAESELYGHERGAFTGAADRRVGHFERAHGGTVFLDEVGELSLDLQKKLLRFLDENVFERIGGSELLHTDVRVIAATNRPLAQLVESGRFREDLYYRLNVVTIHIPGLRDRGEDIVLLATHFLSQVASSKSFSPEALRALSDCAWPGNVRELRNAVQHAAVLSKGEVVRAEDLPPSVMESHARVVDDLDAAVSRFADEELKGEATEDLYASALARFERPLIQRVLEFTGGNQLRAARILGLHRTTLRKKIAEYGL